MNRYNRPTTYKRIVPDRGCGFILKRIWDLTENPNIPPGTYCKKPTKQDVYCGTKWANRPGFASLLWSSLIKDGLIEPNGGMQKYKYHSFCMRSHVGTRAAGRYAPGIGYAIRYHLTPKGCGVLFDMMARVNKNKTPELNTVSSVAEYDAKKDENGTPAWTEVTGTAALREIKSWRKEKEAFCERNGIEFGTGKTLNTVGSVAEYDAKKDEEVPPGPAERKDEIWNKLDNIISDLVELRNTCL